MTYIKNNLLSIVCLILILFIAAAGIKYMGHINDNLQTTNNQNSSTQNPINNYIEILGDEGNVSFAASKGLRSAVSVYCSFTATSSGSWPWNPYPTEQTYYSAGSGVIYDLDKNGNAFVITNYHVVYDADCNTENHISDKIFIYLFGKESEKYAIEASYIGGSPNYDIAILRVEESEILAQAFASGAAAPISIASSDEISAGDVAIAIGNPSASDVSGISVTKGIISVDSEYITMTGADERSEVTYRVIRVDTPINSGNSGGGLFNSNGELIGIVNAKISSSNIENIGYAIPSSIVRAVADNIIDYCYLENNSSVMRCILGITIQASGLDTYYDSESGVLKKVEQISVAEVSSNSLAENKLKAGDVVKSITIGEKTVAITRQHHLIDTMLDARVGDEIVFTVLRNNEEITISITVNENCLTKY